MILVIHTSANFAGDIDYFDTIEGAEIYLTNKCTSENFTINDFRVVAGKELTLISKVSIKENL